MRLYITRIYQRCQFGVFVYIWKMYFAHLQYMGHFLPDYLTIDKQVNLSKHNECVIYSEYSLLEFQSVFIAGYRRVYSHHAHSQGKRVRVQFKMAPVYMACRLFLSVFVFTLFFVMCSTIMSQPALSMYDCQTLFDFKSSM